MPEIFEIYYHKFKIAHYQTILHARRHLLCGLPGFQSLIFIAEILKTLLAHEIYTSSASVQNSSILKGLKMPEILEIYYHKLTIIAFYQTRLHACRHLLCGLPGFQSLIFVAEILET